ncbi:MAG: YHS domain-containing protein [Chloroflexi bacterium]|nr:YHS domain-containing protein [Chloroflexota bacterium]
MRLDPECAPARLPYGDRIYHFCSFNCAQKFAQGPDTYVMA